ncbi:TRAP transporter small permease [Granulosicoccaceae sp. 1_MG-2023]|nr:TRAP transporter small permease [Granulosicoccaceae sp. 1_MG-2023]
MSKFPAKLKKVLDVSVLTFCGLALVLMVVTVTWQVFSRYFLNDPSSFTDELSRYTMIWLGMLGASYLFGQSGHLGISLIHNSLPERGSRALRLFVNVLILSFVSLAMLKGGIALMSKTMQQYSPALNIPMAYVYLILPVSAVLIIVYLLISMLDTASSESHQ